jgi:hypothetical protein
MITSLIFGLVRNSGHRQHDIPENFEFLEQFRRLAFTGVCIDDEVF